MRNYAKRFDDLLCTIKSWLFVITGKKPWSRGYVEYKWKNIRTQLRCGEFNSRSLPHGYGFRIDERIVEYPWLLERLPPGNGRLLDAGSVLNFPDIITSEKITSKDIYILTLAPEPNCFWKNKVSYIYEDLRETSFRDEYFDWIVSLSTIEHVGLDNTRLYTNDGSKNECNTGSYIDAIRELKRLLKPTGTLYLSMPFGRHRNHGWFQVFDAEMVDRLTAEFSPSGIDEYYFKYSSNGWSVSSREESIDATFFDIHTSQAYDDDFAAGSRAIVCLELRK